MEKLASYIPMEPARLVEQELFASAPLIGLVIALVPVALALLTRHRLCLLETIALALLAIVVYSAGDVLLAATLTTFALINAARGFERRRVLELQRRSGQRLQQLDEMVEGFLTGLDRRSQANDFHRESPARDGHPQQMAIER
ncbi:hypothetical protein [Mesorhizobium sp. CAU 1741]|uniref:hypothetical protein n=1 Tax=Mesorhizobium sp. CAU 1741 TaxID=3140366 RepID=UPI00325A54A8